MKLGSFLDTANQMMTFETLNGIIARIFLMQTILKNSYCDVMF